MTTLYLIRHSKPLKVNNSLNQDDFQLQNEKSCLCIEGEKIAEEKLLKSEYDDIDALYSSSCVRAIQTAKYLLENNNIELNVVSNLGERKLGVSSWDKLPDDFEMKQFLDENYKVESGESQKEVRKRMCDTVMNILNKNKNKKIAIVSHATTITYLLKKWCDISAINDKFRYSFNNKILLDGFIDYCTAFKLEFDSNNDIINVRLI